VTVGDATKPLASRIWEHWMPFGTESEAEVVAIASARAPLADVLASGSASGSWKLTRADKLGQARSAVHPPLACHWMHAHQLLHHPCPWCSSNGGQRSE
jgi:hypothetical protein